MNRSLLSGIIIGIALAGGTALHGQTKPAIAKRDDLFGPDKLWSIHLRIGAKEWEAMQPKGGFAFGKFPMKKDEPKPKPKDKEKGDIHVGKLFGMEFPYVKADMEFEGQKFADVAVRFKGNSTYMSSTQGLKRPLKIDVNRYVEDQSLHGISMLPLANNTFDATRIREALGYALFRAAGVPASRTAFVKLNLTVPGKHDNVYVGLYTLIEPVDKTFLRNHFKDTKGMLLKPEKIQGLPYLGEDWKAYDGKYNPKRPPSAKQARRLIDFTKFLDKADDQAFRDGIADFLDVDGFLRYLAVNSIIANIDSFVGLGHNYYLYLDAKTNRFHFIPWDLDLTFANFPMMASAEQQIDWSIAKPYMGKNRLVERLLAIKDYDRAYRGHLATMTRTAFAKDAINDAIAVLEKTVKDAVALEPKLEKKDFGPFNFKTNTVSLREFTSKRLASIVAQLDGKSEGKTLGGFGFGGGKGGFGLGAMLSRPIMTAVDADKDGKLSLDEVKSAMKRLFKECGGVEGKSIDDKALAAAIDRLLPPPPMPKGVQPKFKFSFGGMVSGNLIKQADGDNDKRLTLDEMQSTAEKLFKEWDKDKNGGLDDKELIEGLNRLFVPARPAVQPNPKSSQVRSTSLLIL